MIITDPGLDGLSPKGNEPPQGGGVNPYPKILGIHNSGGPKSCNRTRMLDCSGAYAQRLLVRTHWLRNQLFGVPPKAMLRTHWLSIRCICTGSRISLLGFACDLLIPFAIFSHYRSELRMLRFETLESTYQGIVRNGKWFKTGYKLAKIAYNYIYSPKERLNANKPILLVFKW
ncbi:hypothetical protein PIB30_058037 [Stylosanthes scabra]|uniref:Uncharacterized protein n=1 Tax=Stylosanthes scabra TaxID=79078 RepID=A0ABU6VIU6_9FABA|nr:hypothetical protein [Stylosanthes scabra]